MTEKHVFWLFLLVFPIIVITPGFLNFLDCLFDLRLFCIFSLNYRLLYITRLGGAVRAPFMFGFFLRPFLGQHVLFNYTLILVSGQKAALSILLGVIVNALTSVAHVE